MNLFASDFRFRMFLRTGLKAVFLVVFCAMFVNSANAKLKKPRNLVWLKMNMKTLSFALPNSDIIFKLHLGEEIESPDTGGVTKAPKGIVGIRAATTSFYEPLDK